MLLKNLSVAMLGLCLLGACSEDGDPVNQGESELADGGAPTAGKPPKKDASSGKPSTSADAASDPSEPAASDPDDPSEPAPSGSADAGGKPATPAAKFDYLEEDVHLKADLVIPKGKTVRVGPDVHFTAAANIKIQVLGTLEVEGSEAAPTTIGSGAPSSWHGVVVEEGGSLTVSHAKIGGAKYGILALPGSRFKVENSEIGTSFKGAVVQSDGSFSHVVFKASTPPTIAITDEVSIDDPNGTLTIMDASPTITNCQFDGSSGFTDMVRIGGMSSPTFDYVLLHNAHCGFHTFGGTNTSARITNAVFEDLSYGIMAYTTKPIVEDSIFRNNGYDLGVCNGATEANAPLLKNNFYAAGAVGLDPSCFRIKTVDAAPASSANTAAGSGL
jgi:hypothetical protein